MFQGSKVSRSECFKVSKRFSGLKNAKLNSLKAENLEILKPCYLETLLP
jgi:hypothetical protein